MPETELPKRKPRMHGKKHRTNTLHRAERTKVVPPPMRSVLQHCAVLRLARGVRPGQTRPLAPRPILIGAEVSCQASVRLIKSVVVQGELPQLCAAGGFEGWEGRNHARVGRRSAGVVCANPKLLEPW